MRPMFQGSIVALVTPFRGGKVDEAKLKELVEMHPRVFAAKAKHVLPFHPTHGVHEVVVVLGLVLVGERRRPDLKAGACQYKFINGTGDIVRRPVDAQITHRHRGKVIEVVVDVYEPETKFIHERRRKKVRLGNVKKARADRRIERKIQRC